MPKCKNFLDIARPELVLALIDVDHRTYLAVKALRATPYAGLAGRSEASFVRDLDRNKDVVTYGTGRCV
jgi:hypothetical protein